MALIRDRVNEKACKHLIFPCQGAFSQLPLCPNSFRTADDLTKKKKKNPTTNKAQKCSGSSVPLGNSRGIGAGGDVSFSLAEQAGELNAVVRYSGSWFPCEAAALRRGRGKREAFVPE